MNIIFGSDKILSVDLKSKLIQKVNDICGEYDYKAIAETENFIILSKGNGETHLVSNDQFTILFDGYVYGFEENNFETFLKNLANRITRESVVLKGNETGIFNIVITDKKENKIYVGNDSSGLIPFYYTIKNDVFYYCSHLHFMGKILNLNIDETSTLQRLIFNNAHLGTRTFYKGLNRICPGEIVIRDISKNDLNVISTQEYYINSKEKKNNTEDEIWNSINTEIKYITDKNRKIGMMLSEGFDSRFIGGIFQINGAELYTFTHGTIQNDKKSVGIKITEDVAQSLNSSHYFHSMENGFPSDFKKIKSQLFLADNLNIAYFYYGAEYFENLGVDCVTTGYGLDSTLGGFFFFKDKYSRFEAVTQRYKEILLQDLNLVSNEYVEKLSNYLIHKIIEVDEKKLRKKISNLFNKDFALHLCDHIGEFKQSISEEFERVEDTGSKLNWQKLQRFSLENITRRCFFGQDLTLRINNKVVVPSYGRLFMKEVSALHPKHRMLHKAYIKIFRKNLKQLAKIKNAGYNLPITRNRLLLESSRFISKYNEIKLMKEVSASKGKASFEKLRAAFNPEAFARKGNLIKNFYDVISDNGDIINKEFMERYLKNIENYKSNASYMNPFFDIIEYETIMK